MRFEIEVWLRYRLDGGRVYFILEIHRREYVEDAAFKAVVTKVEKAIGSGAKAIFAA